MPWLQGAENMKEQPKTTEEKKKIKQGFCLLRSPVYAQISERQDLCLCLSCFPFFLSASHKDKKLVFFVWFFIYLSPLAVSPTTRAACAGSCCLYTQIHTHTHLYVPHCMVSLQAWEERCIYLYNMHTSGHLCKPAHYAMSHWTIPVGSCNVNNIWQHKQTKERIRKVFISSIVTPTHNILLLRSETCNVYSASGSRV